MTNQSYIQDLEWRLRRARSHLNSIERERRRQERDAVFGDARTERRLEKLCEEQKLAEVDIGLLQGALAEAQEVA